MSTTEAARYNNAHLAVKGTNGDNRDLPTMGSRDNNKQPKCDSRRRHSSKHLVATLEFVHDGNITIDLVNAPNSDT